MNQSTRSHLLLFLSRKNMADWLIFISVNERAQCKKNACWVFETVRIILIIISLICFTEKVYGSSPYSPIHFCIHFLISACDRPVDCSIEMESFPQDHGDPSGLENNNLFQWIQSDRYFQISDKQTHSSSLIFVCE